MPVNEKQFDAMLLRNRQYEPPSSNLAERIIQRASTARKKTRINIFDWLGELLSFVFPQPRFALACMLMAGLAIGFSAGAIDPEDPTISYLDEEGISL